MKERILVKYLRPTLALLVAVLVALGYFAMPTHAWPDLDDLTDDAQDWWDDATDDAQDWWDDATDDAQDWWDDATDDMQDQWDDVTDDARTWVVDTTNQASKWLNEVKEELREDFDSAIEKIKSQPYVEEAWNEVSVEMKRQLCEDYNDPAKVGELERKRGLVTEVALTAIKIMPVYDSERKQIRTFNGFATDLVNENPALVGSDLARDPARCAALLLLDSDYLLYAKIIQTNDGKWISIEEARVAGYQTTEVNAAKSDYLQAKSAYALEDSKLFEKHIKSFSTRIQSINSGSTPYPSWLLPTAIVAIGGVVSIGLLVNRNRRKNGEKAQ